MTPRRASTRPAGRAEAKSRLRLASKYLEAADLVATEDGEAINVAIGMAVLSGIAAADAICISALGERSSAADHAAAVGLLAQVNRQLSLRLRTLMDLKAAAHYGDLLLGKRDLTSAMRAARTLVDEARARTV